MKGKPIQAPEIFLPDTKELEKEKNKIRVELLEHEVNKIRDSA